jgi:hypothetical protein
VNAEGVSLGFPPFFLQNHEKRQVCRGFWKVMRTVGGAMRTL